MKRATLLIAMALLVSWLSISAADAQQTCFGKRATIRGSNSAETLRGTAGAAFIF